MRFVNYARLRYQIGARPVFPLSPRLRDANGIATRPLHIFFSEGQVSDAQMRWIGSQLVVEATGKLDGVMVYGVPIDGVMSLMHCGRGQGLSDLGSRRM